MGHWRGSRSGRANASRRVFTSSPDLPDLPQGDPFTAFTPGAGLNNVGSFQSPMPQWYVPNWGLSLQHRLGENTMIEAGYQGSRSVHEYLIREVNDAEPLLAGTPAIVRRGVPFLSFRAMNTCTVVGISPITVWNSR